LVDRSGFKEQVVGESGDVAVGDARVKAVHALMRAGRQVWEDGAGNGRMSGRRGGKRGKGKREKEKKG